jgi:hypothetical protein
VETLEEPYKPLPGGTPGSTDPGIPVEWETHLDEDKQDEAVFEICFMEELLDILSDESNTDGVPEDEDTLPHSFLPLVTNSDDCNATAEDALPENALELEVVSEEVLQNTRFRLELDGMLKRIRTMDEPEEISLVSNLPGEGKPDREVDHEQEDNHIKLHDLDICYETISHHTVDSHSSESGNSPEPEVYEKEHSSEPDCPATGNPDNMEIVGKDHQAAEILLLPISTGAATEPQMEDAPVKSTEEVGFHMENIPETEEPVELNSGESMESPEEGPETVETAYSSIFYELFRTADTESKLILLDEILSVGDEKELQFIRNLTSSPDKRLRTKAILLSGQLQEILERRRAESQQAREIEFNGAAPGGFSSEEVGSHDPLNSQVGVGLRPLEDCFLSDPYKQTGEPFNMFEVEFELTPEESELTATLAEPRELNSSLLGNILSLPIKIIEKFNG